jgi:probable F420-dependent oxidoreductase
MTAARTAGATTAKPLTFGVNIREVTSAAALREEVLAAERGGMDVLALPDHLGAPAPFAVAAAAAQVSTRLRLRTYVLNTYFWNPALLAREVATVDALSDGRFELGLGAGHMKSEHDDAGLPFPPHARRVEQTEALLLEVQRRLGSGDHVPEPVQKPVPVVLGGWGPRILTLAARRADVIAVAGVVQVPGTAPGTFRLASEAETVERLGLLQHRLATERPADAPAPVLDALLQQVVVDRPPEQAAAEFAALFASVGRDVSAAELLDSPFVLYAPTPEDAAAELLRRRDRYGITSWLTHAASGPALAEVAAQFT